MHTNQLDLENYKDLIWKEVHKCFRKLPLGARVLWSHEDLHSEALLEIYTKFESYNPERGAISTFLTVILQNKFTNLMKYYYQQKQGGGSLHLSLEQPLNEEEELKLMEVLPSSNIDETGVFIYDISQGDKELGLIAKDYMDGYDYHRSWKRSRLPLIEFNQKLDILQKKALNLLNSVYNNTSLEQNTEDDMVIAKKKLLKKPKAKLVPTKPKAKLAKKVKVPTKKAKTPKIKKAVKTGNLMEKLDPQQVELVELLLDHTVKKFKHAEVKTYHNRICASIPGKKGRLRLFCIFSAAVGTVMFHIRYLSKEAMKLNKENGTGFKRQIHSDCVKVINKKQAASLKPFIQLRVDDLKTE